jgi:alkylation response protein AidB-like acyl-CoA dehydrogenase
MGSLLLSRRDLEFLLYEWLNVEGLTQAVRHADHNRETFDAVLDTCERLGNEFFSPHYQKADRQEPSFDGDRVTLIPEVSAALEALAATGLLAAQQDYSRGGMQLPLSVEKAGFAYLYAANVATTAFALLTIANANLLLAHGSAAQIDAFAEPQLSGRYFGTMCLSEPQAGSSLSDITTRADYECESPWGPQYRLTGNKMWISGGDHELGGNIIHLVLAKIPDSDYKLPAGVKGISLFIVPKYLIGMAGERNDVVCAGLNHKMGYRGLPNCLLNFGEGTRHRPGGRAGAIGYLVGGAHRGLDYMFHMMNEARIGIGLGASMLGYTGYLHALDYARNRAQGRSVGAGGKNPSSPQRPIIEHADVRRMLLAQKAYAEGALALTLYCAKLVDETRITGDESERAQLMLLLEMLTPITKSWPSQWCLVANDLAIQVHGGYGYTREFKVEQFYRDNRLNPIHEGTHGIQAIDLLGRKVMAQDGAALLFMALRVEQTVARAAQERSMTAWGEQLALQFSRLQAVTQVLRSVQDRQLMLANASVYLEAFGHITLAWIWLEQALCTIGHDSEFYRGKRNAARYFFRWELPKVSAQLDRLEDLDTTLVELDTNSL